MLDLEALEPQLRAALAEDIGPGDVTTELLVPATARAHARIVAKEAGTLAGIAVAVHVLRLATDGDLTLGDAVIDGTVIHPGEVVLAVDGNARGLLRGERTALNYLIRLSGIATQALRFVEAVKGTGAHILDTRKTTPGLRALEKYAVLMGGAHNHRFALYDGVLVKENHLAFGGSLAEALAARPAGMPAIVEAESVAEFRRAAAAGADVVMLDDFTPAQVTEAVALREGGRPLLEVSGGITLKNVRAYAEAGVDRISIGALTHSAPALDLSMRLSVIA